LGMSRWNAADMIFCCTLKRKSNWWVHVILGETLHYLYPHPCLPCRGSRPRVLTSWLSAPSVGSPCGQGLG
jgi:hypothetical protein